MASLFSSHTGILRRYEPLVRYWQCPNHVPSRRVRNRHRSHQAFGIWVLWVGKYRTRWSHLHDLTEIHDCYFVAHAFDNRHVVRNEQVEETKRLLEVKEDVDHLSLDGNVQFGD